LYISDVATSNDGREELMKNSHQLVVVIFAQALAAFAQSGSVTTARAQGYLNSSQLVGVVRIVPEAPMTGDPRFQTDMSIFKETRKLDGTPRWKLAQSDDNLSLPGLLSAFACALDTALTPANAPKTATLLNRANEDAYIAADILKKRYQHKRPFQLAEGDVCVSPQGRAALEKSPDYPSGHTTLSWETGLIVAELNPEHAIDILARARAFGQSRVVCGVHNLSAVEAGWMTATAVFDMQMSSTEFRKDLDSARAELASLKTVAASAKLPNCEAEVQILSKDPY
jgi:acid phosphatase (class A)